MLETALTHDQSGVPVLRDSLTSSREWADVNAFCHNAYMPLKTRPLNRGDSPDAVLRKLKIGQITFSRFCFGVPTLVDDFDPASGNIIVLNTLRGSVRHPLGQRDEIETRAGDSYVVDCSRTEYWNVANGDDLQFNLTISHRLLEETAQRWFGFVPQDDLWTRRCVFGGAGSAWLSMLDYAARSVDARLDTVASPMLARRIEENICIELLMNWTKAAGMDLSTAARAAAPRHVREAEKLMADLADTAPTIGQIAGLLGVSARSLSEGFRQFRGITPHGYLTARRLDGLRGALLAAPPGSTVAAIAHVRGYVNLGAMTAAYRDRFGETPAQTLRQRIG